jgi:hypothetical protein
MMELITCEIIQLILNCTDVMTVVSFRVVTQSFNKLFNTT